MDTKSLALHLIKEDIKYHGMVAGCTVNHVHIEFFPDMASVVKSLLGQDSAGDDWEDRYVSAMGKTQQIDWTNHIGMDTIAEQILKSLRSKSSLR